MKYSNTTIRELNARYRSVLKKCFMLNAMVLMGLASNTAFAGDYDNLHTLTPETANMGTVTIENEHVTSEYGSVYIVPNGVTGVIGENSVIRNNTAGIGTISVSKKEGVLQVGSGTVFENNTAKYDGGAIGNYGGAIIADNVTFTGNKAQTGSSDSQAIGGGAISLGIDAHTTITGSTFTNNTSGYSGGAIGTRKTLQDSEVADAETRNSLTIENSVFKGNEALGTLTDTSDKNLLSSGNGGAIANTFATTRISGTTFDGNKALNSGGAIFNMPYENAKSTAFYDVGGAMTLSDSTFSNNSAGKNGGAIFNGGDMTIDGGSFSNNTATSYFSGGGAIFNQGSLTINNGTVFENNSAYVGGAISDVYDVAAQTTISGAQFNNNHSIWDGGAIGAYSKMDISDTVFSGNTAAVTVDGVTGDTSNSDGGGAIMVGGTSDVSLTNVQFIGNESGVRGGAISARHGKDRTLTMDTVEFTNNKAGNFGGAIASIYQGAVDVKNGQFTGNEAAKAGGAIYIGVDTNYGAVGGVTSTNHGTLNLSGENVFTGNTAGEKGGAIYADEGATINLSGTNTFTGNTAAGSANDIYNLGALNITGGTTTIDGGIDGTGALTVSGATLDIGTAKVVQDSITFDAGSTLKANLLNTSSYGSLEANTIAGNGAKLNLTVGAAGEYQIAVGEGADSFAEAEVDSSSLYDIVKTSEDSNTLTYTASVKAAEDIASDAGVSTQTASVLSTLANASNDTASQIALNMQNELAAGNNDTVESAAKDLAPTDTATVHSVATSVHSQILGAVNNRLATPVMGRSGGDLNAKFGPWVQGLYNKSKQDSSSSTTGFRGYTQGVAFGLDTLINDVYTVGVGYAYNATDVKSGGRKTDIYGHNFFVYGEYQPNAWFVNGTVNYSTSDYKEHRNVVGVGVTGKYDVDTWGGQVMTGYDMASGFTPKAGLRYLHIKQDSYTDTAGQQVKTDNTDLLTAVAGVNYAYDFIEEDYTLTPEVRLAATYDIVSDNTDATVFMGTGSYTTSGKRLPRFGVEAGVGVTMNMFDALDVSLNYDAGIRRDYTSHTGTVKFKYNF